MNNNTEMEQLVANSEAHYALLDASYEAKSAYYREVPMEYVAEDLYNQFQEMSQEPQQTQQSYYDKYSMTYNNEIGVDSNTVHVPSSNSGVTIGPGYDLAHRKEEDVYLDLTSIGISEQDSRLISQGAGLTGEDAKAFNEGIKHIINLSDEEQKELFNKVVPVYIERAKADYEKLNIDNKPEWDDLPNTVTSLLVDYAYNVGVTTFPSFFKALIQGDRTNAEKHYTRYTTINGKKVKLGRRNTDTKDVLDNYDFKDLRNGK